MIQLKFTIRQALPGYRDGFTNFFGPVEHEHFVDGQQNLTGTVMGTPNQLLTIQSCFDVITRFQR